MMEIAIIAVLVLCIYLAVRRAALGVIGAVVLPGVLLTWMGATGDFSLASAALGVPVVALFVVAVAGDAVREPGAVLFARASMVLTALFVGGGISFLFLGPAFGALLMVAFVGATIAFALRSREATAMQVLSTLSAAMRQNLPLHSAVAAAAHGRGDAAGRALARIAACLEKGMPLSLALRVAYRACPGHAVAMAALGERLGRPTDALRRIEAELKAQDRRRRQPKVVHPGYLLLLLLFSVGMVSMLGIYIIPKFQDITAGMGAEIPRLTEVVYNTAGPVGQLGVVLWVLLLLGILLWLATALISRRQDRTQWLHTIFDALRWRLPGWRWFERQQATLRTVEALRLALEGGCTVDAAIAGTLELDVNACYRARLAGWLARVRRGEDLSQAATRSRLDRAIAWAFDPRGNPSGAPQALEMIETALRARVNYRAVLARTVLMPCVVVAIGVGIGLIVLATFLPIARINAIVMGRFLP
ncbi:MAG TPA: type II secretion system F family protein [Phycisphaerae bacterium]|nr:type II secretion system F family protein [Phycisphaerae bacterium]